MLQFGGHHLALNITIAGDKGVLTPTLTGAQPGKFTLNGKTVRPVGRESDKALALLHSLDAQQQAILNNVRTPFYNLNIDVGAMWARRLIDRDTDAARREMEEAESVARHALAEVRSAVTGIRATGLAAELASARLLLNASMVQFEYVSNLPELPERLEAGLALVLREAVTNIHRHAHASSAEARLDVTAGQLTLCIADNGSGGVGSEGNGICGMRERVRALGGTLAFESERGKGTRVRIVVPLTAADRRLAPTTEPDASLGLDIHRHSRATDARVQGSST